MVTVWYSQGGSLMASESIPGVTQQVTGDTAMWYQGHWFICETISESAARAIAQAMGWAWSDTPQTALVTQI